MNFKNILVTTDFSDLSKEAFDFAAYQAKMESSEVTLLNILQEFFIPGELQPPLWSVEGEGDLEERHRSEAQSRVEEFAKEYFHGQSVEAISIYTNIAPAAKICDFAKDNACDLIVMAAHGRGGLGSLFLGSVVQKVIGGAPCPVLVIRGKNKS